MSGQNKSEADDEAPVERPEAPKAKGFQPAGQGSPPPPPLPKKDTERFRIVPGEKPQADPVARTEGGPTVVNMPPSPGASAQSMKLPAKPKTPQGPQIVRQPAPPQQASPQQASSQEQPSALGGRIGRRSTDKPISDASAAPPAPAEGKKRSIAIPPSVDRVLTSTTSSPRHKIEAWLAVMCKEGASDLILRASGRPSLRVNGRIEFLPGRVPGPGALLEVLEGVMGERRMEIWRETGSSDAGLHLDGLGRFRLNAYKQIGEPAVVIRRISEDAPSINGLNLPAEELKRLAMKKRGLVLVTGVAGSGKSTTLGGMIEHMNQTVERHVVTLEDPVELLFKENRCVISQREVGTDCTSFQDGLRHALRQSPDVILIGEMRDAETVMAALDASETGHLVLSTLHTVNAPQTVERILSFFPAEQHKQVRSRLSDNIAGVMSQRLVAKADDSGLVPAFELMVSTPHVRELLALGDTAELARVIDGGTENGLVSFNQSLRQLVLKQTVHLDEAMQASDRPEELVLALRGITGSNAKVDNSQRVRRQPEGGNDGLRMASSGE